MQKAIHLVSLSAFRRILFDNICLALTLNIISVSVVCDTDYMPLFAINKHLFNGLQVAVAIYIIGLQVAGFGPLVPTVDGN
jgi:hypothetical protein